MLCPPPFHSIPFRPIHELALSKCPRCSAWAATSRLTVPSGSQCDGHPKYLRTQGRERLRICSQLEAGPVCPRGWPGNAAPEGELPSARWRRVLAHAATYSLCVPEHRYPLAQRQSARPESSFFLGSPYRSTEDRLIRRAKPPEFGAEP